MTVSEYYSWLKRDWAKAGLPIAVFLFVFLWVFVRPSDFVVFLLLLQTPLYMLHETEEYIFPGGFGAFFNVDIFGLDTPDAPIDDEFIFFINVILIWIVLPLFGLLAVRDYSFGLWIPYFSFFAGAAHIGLGIKARKWYNPGLIVSLLLNIPVGFWVVMQLVNLQIITNPIWNPHMLIGLGVNALLPVTGFILLRRYQSTSRTIEAT
jgi:hypothetical protein